jgi:uncharacterized membrane protein required for colicin V production
MIPWLLILIGLATAFVGLKKGFFFMFATQFLMMFAAYIAVLTTPMLLSVSPGYETNGYYAGGSVIVLFFLIFSVLEGFGWYFFLRDREDYFPKMLEKAGGVLVGFLCGYVFFCVLLLAFCIMPCSRGKVDWLSTRENLRNLVTPAVFRVCNFLGWYSLECFDGNVERAVEQLLTLNDPKEEDVTPVFLPKEITAPRPVKPSDSSAPESPSPAPRTTDELEDL